MSSKKGENKKKQKYTDKESGKRKKCIINQSKLSIKSEDDLDIEAQHIENEFFKRFDGYLSDEDFENELKLLNGPSEVLYEVESIQNHRGTGKKREYFIKWKGYNESENTWEPLDNLSNILFLVEQYEEGLRNSSSSSKKSFKIKINKNIVNESIDSDNKKRKMSEIEQTKNLEIEEIEKIKQKKQFQELKIPQQVQMHETSNNSMEYKDSEEHKEISFLDCYKYKPQDKQIETKKSNKLSIIKPNEEQAYNNNSITVKNFNSTSEKLDQHIQKPKAVNNEIFQENKPSVLSIALNSHSLASQIDQIRQGKTNSNPIVDKNVNQIDKLKIQSLSNEYSIQSFTDIHNVSSFTNLLTASNNKQQKQTTSTESISSSMNNNSILNTFIASTQVQNQQNSLSRIISLHKQAENSAKINQLQNTKQQDNLKNILDQISSENSIKQQPIQKKSNIQLYQLIENTKCINNDTNQNIKNEIVDSSLQIKKENQELLEFLQLDQEQIKKHLQKIDIEIDSDSDQENNLDIKNKKQMSNIFSLENDLILYKHCTIEQMRIKKKEVEEQMKKDLQKKIELDVQEEICMINFISIQEASKSIDYPIFQNKISFNQKQIEYIDENIQSKTDIQSDKTLNIQGNEHKQQDQQMNLEEAKEIEQPLIQEDRNSDKNKMPHKKDQKNDILEFQQAEINLKEKLLTNQLEQINSSFIVDKNLNQVSTYQENRQEQLPSQLVQKNQSKSNLSNETLLIENISYQIDDNNNQTQNIPNQQETEKIILENNQIQESSCLLTNQNETISTYQEGIQSDFLLQQKNKEKENEQQDQSKIQQIQSNGSQINLCFTQNLITDYNQFIKEDSIKKNEQNKDQNKIISENLEQLNQDQKKNESMILEEQNKDEQNLKDENQIISQNAEQKISQSTQLQNFTLEKNKSIDPQHDQVDLIKEIKLKQNIQQVQMTSSQDSKQQTIQDQCINKPISNSQITDTKTMLELKLCLNSYLTQQKNIESKSSFELNIQKKQSENDKSKSDDKNQKQQDTQKTKSSEIDKKATTPINITATEKQKSKSKSPIQLSLKDCEKNSTNSQNQSINESDKKRFSSSPNRRRTSSSPSPDQLQKSKSSYKHYNKYNNQQHRSNKYNDRSYDKHKLKGKFSRIKSRSRSRSNSLNRNNNRKDRNDIKHDKKIFLNDPKSYANQKQKLKNKQYEKDRQYCSSSSSISLNEKDENILKRANSQKDSNTKQQNNSNAQNEPLRKVTSNQSKNLCVRKLIQNQKLFYENQDISQQQCAKYDGLFSLICQNYKIHENNKSKEEDYKKNINKDDNRLNNYTKDNNRQNSSKQRSPSQLSLTQKHSKEESLKSEKYVDIQSQSKSDKSAYRNNQVLQLQQKKSSENSKEINLIEDNKNKQVQQPKNSIDAKILNTQEKISINNDRQDKSESKEKPKNSNEQSASILEDSNKINVETPSIKDNSLNLTNQETLNDPNHNQLKNNTSNTTQPTLQTTDLSNNQMEIEEIDSNSLNKTQETNSKKESNQTIEKNNIQEFSDQIQLGNNERPLQNQEITQTQQLSNSSNQPQLQIQNTDKSDNKLQIKENEANNLISSGVIPKEIENKQNQLSQISKISQHASKIVPPPSTNIDIIPKQTPQDPRLRLKIQQQEQKVISFEMRIKGLQQRMTQLDNMGCTRLDQPDQILSHIYANGQLYFKVSWKPRLKDNIQMPPTFIEYLKLQENYSNMLNKYLIQKLSNQKIKF